VLTALAQPNVPQIPFDANPEFLQLPDNLYLGEASGVAVNSKGHVFCFLSRVDNWPRVRGSSSAGLEFDEKGKYIREIGRNLYAWSFAHDDSRGQTG